jgi:4-diphosphocytidyl-2-C-methyl-D-erythritol kinase
MSGSGACCFVAFADADAARAAHAQLPADLRGVVARGLNRHPLAAPSASTDRAIP